MQTSVTCHVVSALDKTLGTLSTQLMDLKRHIQTMGIAHGFFKEIKLDF